jgi:hypothetical protein
MGVFNQCLFIYVYIYICKHTPNMFKTLVPNGRFQHVPKNIGSQCVFSISVFPICVYIYIIYIYICVHTPNMFKTLVPNGCFQHVPQNIGSQWVFPISAFSIYVYIYAYILPICLKHWFPMDVSNMFPKTLVPNECFPSVCF